MNNYFENYEKLVARVDDLCQQIENRLAGHLACKSGCSSCCLEITLFPVEADALKRAFNELPEQERGNIRRHLEGESQSESCCLLKDDRCLLYRSRPLICRTHGLPILYREDGVQKVDCCPKNRLSGITVTGSDLVDLDRLNSLLVAVNSLYLTQIADKKLPERMSIIEALLPEKP